MEKIITYFENQLEKSNNYYFKEQEKLDLFSNFLKKYELKLNTLNNYLTLNYSDVMIVLICLYNKLSIQGATEFVNPIKPLLDNIDFDDDYANTFFDNIKTIYTKGKEALKTICKNDKIFKNDTFLNFIEEVANLKIFDYFISICFIKFTYKEMCYIDDSKDKIDSQKILVSELNKNESYKMFHDCFYGDLKKEIQRLWKLKLSEEQENIKLKQVYTDILSEIKKEGIIHYNNSFFEIDENLQRNLLVAIMIHNEKLYKEQEKKYLQIKSNPNHLSNIFKQNGYDLNLISKQNQDILIACNDLDKISMILPIIKNSPFYIKETDPIFIKVLLYSNNLILNKIKDYFNKEIWSEEFIRNYPLILLSYEYEAVTSESYSYETLITNINYLLSKNFNIMNIRKSNPSMLIIKNDILKNYISRLEKYQINFETQKNINYSYITSDTTLIIIDRFIELGLKDYIINNIEYIYNNADDIIKRIYISNKIGYNIWNKDNDLKNSINNGYNFPIPTNELDNYIASATNIVLNKQITACFKNQTYEITSLINILDSKFLYNGNYLFDNIIISRNKVIRNISSINYEINENNTNEILINAIIYNSILEIDEIEIIKDKINTLLEKNKTKIKN